ncbi:MAG: hypothetical protein KC549_10605, partial [Myxococcales bacterium]|nr:hypothetical protein [Myxococcales bacterium]
MRADTDLSVLAWIIDFARDALTSRSRRRLRGAFGQTALALDLDAELGGGRTARVFGTLRGYPVALRLTARGPRDDGTVAEVDVSSGLPPGLGLRVRVDATPSQVALAIDPELDRALVLTGDATRWLTLLDAPTRRRVRRLLPDGLSLQDGWLRVSVPERVEDAARLQRWLRELAALAEDLDLTRRPLALRLLQGARQAPEAAERVRCLTALAAGGV